MDPERWRQVDDIFKSALEVPEAERAAFVERACAGDEGLRREVESLIEYDREGGPLDRPVVTEAARLIAAEGGRSREGKAVGPYRIVSRIGAGGMGEVHLAVHERTGRKVALKLLPEHLTRDEQRVRRFRQEAQAVLRLNHPNIVTVYDIEQADGESVIASEFIEGETLRARLSRGPLPLAEALDVAAQTAAALAAAHAEGVVHRDVKPENVMLRPDGFVKVLDFGLAKLNEEVGAAAAPDAFKTDPGVVMGTVAYMSPEQARGREVDARTDIWSLGVMLYEMAAGRAPFAGETPTDVLAAVVGKEPAPLARFVPDAPDALEWLVTKTLTKDREGRYQTAKELLTDLRRLKQQLEFEAASSRAFGGAATSAVVAPSHAGAVSSPGASTSPGADAAQTGGPARQTSSAEVIFGELKRHRRGVLFALVLLACLAAAGGFGLYRLMRGRGASQSPFQKMGVRLLADTGQAVDAAVSPDGEFVAFVKDEAGRQSLWLRQTSEASSVQIVPPAGVERLHAPLFSSDGASVYYLKAPPRGHLATLYRVGKLGGGETKLVEAISLQDTRSNFALSPDGRQLAFVRLDPALNRSLVITNHDGAGQRVLYQRKLPEFISGAAWSQDGRTIAFVQGTFVGPKVFMALDVADGSVRQLSERKWKSVGGFAWTGDTGALVVAAAESGELYQLWRLPFAGGEAERITNDVNTYTGVSLSKDSSVLATVQFNVVQNIWTATATAGAGAGEASGLTRLTHGAGRYDGDRGVAWAPDGRIVYHSLVGGGDDVWVMNADGTGQRRLTDGASTNIFPAVSPDGRHVLYNSDKGGSGEVHSIWRMGLDGSDARPLKENCGLPAASPDSRWALCNVSGSGIIWRVPLDGGEPERVRLPEDAGAAAPAVSPDGRLVAYNYSTREPGAQWRIAVFPFDGGAAPLKTFDVVGSPIRLLRWTADGRAVCHVDTREGVSNVVCLPLDGSEPLRLTDFKSERIGGFAISADGRRLVLSRVNYTSGVVLVSNAK
jgi:serine/threonine protein kinase/Tol biopolymer transport system component